MSALLRDIRRLLVEEKDAEVEAQRLLGERAVGDLVANGNASWGVVDSCGRGAAVVRLGHAIARVRTGDYVRILPADGFEDRLPLHRLIARLKAGAWDSQRLANYRCIERVDDRLRIDRRLAAKAGDRVLLLDPQPLIEVFEVLHRNANRILAVPLLTGLELTPPGVWAPNWVSFEDAVQEAQRSSDRMLVIQGPPGCGKTRLIASVALDRQRRGQSVLAVAYTHRALAQIAREFVELMEPGDAAPSYRERSSTAVPHGCGVRPDIPAGAVCRGGTLLATATAAALAWRDTPPGGWDLVILDEASQVALPMILAAAALGNHAIVVGDPQQLPPVTRSDVGGTMEIAEGLTWLSRRTSWQVGIREIRRLNKPICDFVSQCFYGGELEAVSVSRGGNRENLLALQDWSCAARADTSRGIVLLCHDGDPDAEAEAVLRLVEEVETRLHSVSPFSGRPLRFAVATPRREHVARLQNSLRRHSGLSGRITIETVDRLQRRNRRCRGVLAGGGHADAARAESGPGMDPLGSSPQCCGEPSPAAQRRRRIACVRSCRGRRCQR